MARPEARAIYRSNRRVVGDADLRLFAETLLAGAPGHGSRHRTRRDQEQAASALRPNSKALIGGRSVEAQAGQVFDKFVPPIDGRVFAEIARGDSADIDAAVAAARAGFEAGSWRQADPKTKKRVLRRFADLAPRRYRASGAARDARH